MMGMASPDWQAIFTRRPDLNPPGHDEVINDMRNNPWRGSKKANVKTESKRGLPLRSGNGFSIVDEKRTRRGN